MTNPILQAVAVFCVAFFLDVLWALYIRRTSHGEAGPAALYGALIFLAGAYNTMSYLEQPWLLGPIAVGAALGTYVIVRRDHATRKAMPSAESVADRPGTGPAAPVQ